jgi:membrane fusion protein
MSFYLFHRFHVSLFRKEAVLQQREGLTGAVSLVQPLSLKLTVVVLGLVVLSIVVFLFNAEYSRKETVRGFLMPNKGVIKSFASQAGTIDKLWVKEGEYVVKGQALVTIITHKSNHQGTDLSAGLTEQLNAQLILLSDEIAQYQLLKSQDESNAQTQRKALINEISALDNQLVLSKQKLSLLTQQDDDFAQLSQKGYLSNIEREQQLTVIFEAKQEQQNFVRLLLQKQNELSQINFNISNIPQKSILNINGLKRQQAEIERQLLQIKSNYQYTVTASYNGVVTGVQIVEGETLSQTKPLLNILPEGAELIAELLLPTRSAGFLQKGQSARLRFDAFPYQRFGFINSEITRIDGTLIIPNEVPLPVTLEEPVYRLRAKLEQQQVKAFGKAFALKSGMLFEADIMLEKRSLIEWLLEPLYSLNGRVS